MDHFLLLAHFCSPKKAQFIHQQNLKPIWQQTADAWQKLKLKPDFISALQAIKQNQAHPILERISANKQWLADNNGQIITIENPLYPPLLKEIEDAPLVLFALGNTSLLQKPSIAVVGSRNASAAGLKLCYQWMKDLSPLQQDLVYVSGGAAGIDAQVHQSANELGLPTVSVFGTSLNQSYPPKNKTLFENILANNGLILSEHLNDTLPKSFQFPRRNRIISGLARATLVMEASLKSGSLITARLAMEQNREVMAAPGSPISQHHLGSNQLLQQGAHLINNADDILAVLNWREDLNKYAQPYVEQTVEQTAAEKSVLQGLEQWLSDQPINIDELAILSKQSIDQTQEQLFDLQMQGKVEFGLGGYFIR